jgi:hypothetical protein
MEGSMDKAMRRRQLAAAQGVYFAATGLWPLIDMRSFERVTGPKADKWLVRTVGVLIAVIGGTLIAAGRHEVPPEIGGLAASSAAGLACIDVRYAAKQRIPPIYLADAAVEAAFVSAWAAVA